FDRQHPIRGYFGDPRTVGLERLGTDRPGSLGSFTFHGGIDIVATPRTPGYAVVSGVAHVKSSDFISIPTGTARTLQYPPLPAAVPPGEPVTAYRTVIGRVKPVWRHVHLAEIDDFRAHNPLDPGHLEPYHDHTVPEINTLTLTTANGAALSPAHVHGS